MTPEKSYPFTLQAVVDRYMVVSGVGTFALCAWYLGKGEFWANGLFLGLMLVANLWFLPIFSRPFFYPRAVWVFLLGQIACLVGTGITCENAIFFGLAIVPINFAFYNFFPQEQIQETALRRWPLMAVLVAALGVAWWQEALVMDATTCFGLAVLILWLTLPACPFAWQQGKAVLLADSCARQRRLFYHDMMNQIHGLSLFLNQKIVARKTISEEECNCVLGEVKLMQAMLQEHFGQWHKNNLLANQVPFTFLQENIVRLITTYLPPNVFHTQIDFTGLLAGDAQEFVGDRVLVPPTSFFRIITNLAKNMAENNSDEARFVFDYQDGALTITAKNHIKALWAAEDVARELGAIILHDEADVVQNVGHEPRRPYLGLESVARLCENLHGHFTFGRDGEYWVAQVVLPLAVAATPEAA